MFNLTCAEKVQKHFVMKRCLTSLCSLVKCITGTGFMSSGRVGFFRVSSRVSGSGLLVKKIFMSSGYFFRVRDFSGPKKKF